MHNAAAAHSGRPFLRTFRHRIAIAFTALSIGVLLTSGSAYAAGETRVRIQTNLGSFVVALDGTRAPLSVANFLHYARKGHYDGTLIHRVVSNFVAQGGGYDPTYVEKPTDPAIPNESGNGLSNLRGTLAMARTDDPHSATAQFYINLADNARLDPQPSRWGYAVFGRVVEGMEVIDEIGAVATGFLDALQDGDVPLQPILIEKVEELK